MTHDEIHKLLLQYVPERFTDDRPPEWLRERLSAFAHRWAKVRAAHGAESRP